MNPEFNALNQHDPKTLYQKKQADHLHYKSFPPNTIKVDQPLPKRPMTNNYNILPGRDSFISMTASLLASMVPKLLSLHLSFQPHLLHYLSR